MKQLALGAVFSIMICGAVNASDYRYETSVRDCNPVTMRKTLDGASMKQRAIITVVSCVGDGNYRDNVEYVRSGVNARAGQTSVRASHRADVCADCVAPIDRVVARRYYVQETVQRYQPVVQYVPADTYVRTYRVDI